MGTDKAFLRLGEITLLEHAIATARDACETVALVGDRERLGPYGSVVEDQFPGQGPLAGIHSALNSKAAAELNLMLAVDMPAIPAHFLTYLLGVARDSKAMATVPRTNGQLQPLCAVYRKEFATVAERMLLVGRNKIEPLFALCPSHIIQQPELVSVGFAPNIFDNVNTPEDWHRVQQQFQEKAE